MQYLGAISKMTEWSLFISKANHSLSQQSKSMPWSNAEEADVGWFYEDLQDLLELIPKKDVIFIIGDWNAKVGSQETPGVTGKFGLGVQNEVGQREYTGHSRHLLPTKEKTLHMDITRWSISNSDWLYSLQPKMEKLYSVSKTRPGADCGSDHELLMAKFRLNWRKWEKPLDHSGRT